MRLLRDNWGLLLGLFVFVAVFGAGTYQLLQRRPDIPATLSGTFAFRTDRDGNFEIYLWDVNERKATRMTSRPGIDGNPSFSPDGRQFVYESWTNDDQADIYVADTVTGLSSNLTGNPSRNMMPSWSPQGERMVFVSDRDGTPSIYTMARNGRDVRRLTDDTGDDSWPSWSPDGTRLVFSSTRGGSAGLYQLNVATCEAAETLADCPVTVVLADDAENTQPSWSPDGSEIAFTSSREGGQAVYVLRLSNNRVRSVTDGPADTDPQWSPDGRRLVFTSQRDGNNEIYIQDLARNRTERVTNNGFDDGQASWLPNPSSEG